MAIILGFSGQQVNLEKQRRYAVKNSGRLSAWGKTKKQIQPINPNKINWKQRNKKAKQGN
ncbi:hypothetical protein [Spiroplasma endosymbiont of 'Nebria riversi']|uniref:hypothetical protein n=1 Tax=Spiroplasma endosymbiont of 'Nebria riversi' TaxID=2792084 RepID=UPI001C0547D4|nr:hypothetical protein [Spiroplasma endosymbiont of 'Nebria riversi']